MPLIKTLPAAAVYRLEHNHQANRTASDAGLPEKDYEPVIKLMVPTGRAIWLLTEFDRENGHFFGLCDLGFGFPEMGYVALSDLESLTGTFGSLVDYDKTFIATKPLSAYAAEAALVGGINV